LGKHNEPVYVKAIQQSSDSMLFIDCVVPATGQPVTLHCFEDGFHFEDVHNEVVPVKPVLIDYDHIKLPLPIGICKLIRGFLVKEFPKIDISKMCLSTNLKRRRIDNENLTLDTVEMIHNGKVRMCIDLRDE
jgi:hypothetical protein